MFSTPGEIVALPLEPLAYAPYGQVIAASAEVPGRVINQGTARRWDRLAKIENLRPTATLDLAVFRCSPCHDLPMVIASLERHPRSTQVFLPMGARRYLIIVAAGDHAPDLRTLAAFVAPGNAGISYRPGIWHHPLVALDAESDFACLVNEDGTSMDTEEVRLPAEPRVRVRVP